MSTNVATANLRLTADTGAAKAAIRAAVGDIRAQLQTVARPVRIDVRADQARLDAQVQAIKTKFQGLGTDLRTLLQVDVSALRSVLSLIGRQVTDLRDIENRLRTSGSGGGGGRGGGTGGGSPGVSNAYAAQLRALQGDLRAGATSTAAFDAATRALKASIDSEIASLRNLGPLTRDQQAKLDALRATSGQASTALRQLADQQARAAQAGAQNAARAQAEAVGRLGRELQAATSQYERGGLSLRGYLREMERIRTAGQGMAAGLQAGTREALALERVMGGLSRNTGRINDQSITKIRADLAAARAEFERATAAAGRFVDKRAAINAYEASMRGLQDRIRQVGERSTVTAGQVRTLNQISAQVRSGLNTINNVPSGAGFAGGIMAALKQLPQFAQVAGGSLGAAAAQAGNLGGSFQGIARMAGPTGMAIAALTVAVSALAAALGASIQTASQFQQTLQDIKALTQPTAAELDRLRTATFDIGKPLGVGARDAAAAVLELNKAGLSAKDAVGGGLKGALELAGAAGISAAEGATLAVSAMTAFGLQSQQLPRIADVFANFSNKTFLSASDLSQAIAAVGPVARDAGIGLEQFSGLMATLAQGGFKNMSDAGTSLKTMLLSLTAPVETGAKALDALKVSAFDKAGAMRPLNDVLGDLRGKLVQLTPQAQKQLLRQIFGQDALRAAQILLREGPKAIDANTAAMKKAGEAQRVARERLDSLQGAQKKFGATLEQLKIQMGTPFLKPLQAIVEFSTRAVESFTNMGSAAGKVTTPLQALGAASQQALAPLGEMLRTFGAQLAALWTNVLQPILQSVHQAWTVVQVAIVTALGVVFQVVRGVTEGVQGILQGFVGSFTQSGQGINLSLAGMATNFAEWASRSRILILAVGKIAGALPGVFKGVGVGIGQILAGMIKTFGGLATAARSVFQAAGGYALAFLRVLGRFASGVSLVIKGSGRILFGFALAVKNAFVDRVQQVLAAAGQMFTTFGEGVGRLLQPAQQAFFTYIVKPAHTMGDFLRAAFDRVVGILGSAVASAGKILTPMGEVLSALGIGLGEALKNAAGAASKAIGSLVDRGAKQADAAYQEAQRAAEARAAATAGGIGSIIEDGLNSARKKLVNFAVDNGTAGNIAGGMALVAGGIDAISTATSGLNADLAQTTSNLNAGFSTAGTQIRTASADFSVGVKTVQSSFAQLGATTDQVMKDVQASFKAGENTATATAKAVQQAAAPPKVLPSGKLTLEDLGLTDESKKSGSKVTATDLANQAQFKKDIRELTDLELGRAKAEALRTNNKKAMTAILAEESRRERERAADAKKGATVDRQAADARATLVREIRQSIAAFKLQSDQGKVTAATQLAFNQRMEDFQAKVAKLPLGLQAGTQALFQQAAALSKNAEIQVKAARVTALSGAALTKYKEALRGKSAAQLRDLEVEARARNLGPQLNAILAEKARRANADAAATKKAAAAAAQAAESAATLERETRQLNERFALQVKQGTVTEASLQTYRQALEDVQAKAAKLPAAVRGTITALIEQGTTLGTQGQQLVARASEIDNLKKAVQEWGYAELQAARARVVANGGDKEKLAILDKEIEKYKTLSDAQAAQASSESRLAGAQADQTNIEGEYENARSAAEGNLARLYQLELEYGQKVADARSAALRATIADEDRQVQEKYAKLLALDGLTEDRRRELEADRDRELRANATRLGTGLAKINQDRAAAELGAKQDLDDALLTADRATRERLRRNAITDLEQRTKDLEAQQDAELENEDLTEQERLDIRKRYQPLLVAAKQAELNAVRDLEIQAEEDRYADELDDARRKGILDEKRLQADGTYLTVRQLLERAHQSELGRIRNGAADDARDYELGVKRDVGKAIVAATRETSVKLKEEADGRVEVQLENLEQLTGAERAAALTQLNLWKDTYRAQGEAGKAAVAQIDAAIKKVTEAGTKARAAVADLIVGDEKGATGAFNTKLSSIGKDETAEDARASAEQQFAELRSTYEKNITDIEAALGQFAKVRDENLTPKELATRAGLQSTLALYQGFLKQTVTAAGQAGDKAAQTFTQAQADKAAESALALVEAQYELARAEGRDGSPAYIAGLQAALAYWRARLLGLKEGTAEYIGALQKITGLETKLTSTKGENGLISGLEAAAGLVGKGGALQSALSAGLTGMAAFFKSGGLAGGRGAILQGAAAFVGGLVDVFRTGDEDIDKVVSTLVSGLQGTLMQLAQGNWIGALVSGVATAVATVIDIFQGGVNSAKKAAEEIKNTTQNVKFFDLSRYAKTVGVGGFWGFLGFKKAEIDQEAVSIAQTLGDAIYNAISTAFLDGIKSGKASFADLGLDVRKDLGQVILQGLIDGFLKGAIMQGILQPFLDAYITAMKSGNAEALAAAANGIQVALGTANTELARFYNTVLVPSSQQMGVFGNEEGSGTTGSASTDLGIPAVPGGVMAAPAWKLDEIQVSIEHTKALRDITPVLARLADEGLAVSAQADVTVRAPNSDLRAYALNS